MKRLVCLAVVFLHISIVFAQNSDEYNKFEIGGNYSFHQIDKSAAFNTKTNFNGFEISATGNLSRYLGLKFDLSGAFKENDFALNSIAPPNPRRFTAKTSIYNYLGGIQIKDNSKQQRVKPFVHFLAGVANIRQTLTGDCPSDVQSICNGYNSPKTGLAFAAGGGIDIKVANRISIRAIQADYNPIQYSGQTSNNFRVGAGLIFH